MRKFKKEEWLPNTDWLIDNFGLTLIIYAIVVTVGCLAIWLIG